MRLSARPTIRIVLATIIVLVLANGMVTVWRDYRATLAVRQATVDDMARLIQERLHRRLARAEAHLDAIADLLGGGAGIAARDPALVSGLLDMALRSDGAVAASLRDRAGAPVAMRGRREAESAPPQDLLLTPSRSPEPFAFAARAASAAGGAELLLSRRLDFADGSASVTAVLTLRLEDLLDLRELQGFALDPAIRLYRSDGMLIAGLPASTPVGRIGADLPAPAVREAASFGSFPELAPIDGRDRLGAYAGLDELGLMAVVGIDRALVFAEWRVRAEWVVVYTLARIGVSLAAFAWIFFALRREEAIRTALRQSILARRRTDDARRRAEAASQAKSQFLAGFGHELRTPLNAIIGFSEMMTSEIFGPLGHPRYCEYAGDIRASGAHLVEIINDLLDNAKAEAGLLTLYETRFALGEVFDFVLRMLQPRAERGGLVLSAETAQPIWLFADETRIRQILLNLVTNAIKYTPPGGAVRVAAALEPQGGILLTVADSGIGIGDGDLARIVQPFMQVDHARNRSGEGTGLGLPLTKRLTELHGGCLELTSQPGAGTIVRVRLPAHRLATEDAAAMEPVPA
jgi:signal transduction histidine kinase